MGLSRTQRAALAAIADDGGTTHIWALKVAVRRASGVTRRALMDRGLVEERFPGCISITPAGRAALQKEEEGR